MFRIVIFLVSILELCKGEDGCRDLPYLDCIKNKTLLGHVIDSFKLPTPILLSCQNKCFHDNRCISYNLGKVDGITRLCELNDADHSSRPTFFVDKIGHEYCPIQNPCLSNPCPPGRFCRPDFDWNTYSCKDGAWSQWSSWVGVYGAGRNRTRTCTKPAPQANGLPCDGPATETKPCLPLTGDDLSGCSTALGMENGQIKDNQITATSFAASSTFPTNFKPSNGRLNLVANSTTYGGWSAGGSRPGLIDQYIQVDLRSTKVITMVATQGREDSNHWVTKYALSYSKDGNNWRSYEGDCTQIFPGNTDQNTIVTNKLKVPIRARFIRLIVKEIYGWAILRMELYGC